MAGEEQAGFACDPDGWPIASKLDDFHLVYFYVKDHKLLEFIKGFMKTDDPMRVRRQDHVNSLAVEIIDRGFKVPKPGTRLYELLIEYDEYLNELVRAERISENAKVKRYPFLVEWRTDLLSMSEDELKKMPPYKFQSGIIPCSDVEHAIEYAEKMEAKGFQVDIHDRDNNKNDMDKDWYESALERYYEYLKGLEGVEWFDTPNLDDRVS